MQQSLLTIRTLDCDVCGRYDTIMLTTEEVEARAKSAEMGIGAYSVIHKDHTRIIYFDKSGEYLGDTIAMNQEEIPENLQVQPLPYYIKHANKQGAFRKLRKFVFSKLVNKSLTIAITGPSRAGKTSLVRYLDTLIPERESTLMPSVPTMGKSKKVVKIGKTTITSLDMGGQEDFWDLWENSIKASDAVVFLLDATSNNAIEVAKAFERVINYRINDIPVLVILNKKDLLLRGEAARFMNSGEFLSLTNLTQPIPNVVAIEASVFEGTAYETTNYEEIPLAEVLTNFLEEYT